MHVGVILVLEKGRTAINPHPLLEDGDTRHQTQDEFCLRALRLRAGVSAPFLLSVTKVCNRLLAGSVIRVFHTLADPLVNSRWTCRGVFGHVFLASDGVCDDLLSARI